MKGRSDPRRHHGVATLEKCHYNFLVPLFLAPILQDSALDKKNLFQSIVCCIELRVSTQDFYFYRLGLKPTSSFVHLYYTSLFLACTNQFP